QLRRPSGGISDPLGAGEAGGRVKKPSDGWLPLATAATAAVDDLRRLIPRLDAMVLNPAEPTLVEAKRVAWLHADKLRLALKGRSSSSIPCAPGRTVVPWGQLAGSSQHVPVKPPPRSAPSGAVANASATLDRMLMTGRTGVRA